MTPEEKQIIRSTIHTLIELTYKLTLLFEGSAFKGIMFLKAFGF